MGEKTANDAVTKATAAHKAKACTPATDEKTKEEKATCAGYEKTIKDEGDLAATAKKLAGNATTALGLAANQNAWHKSALAHATTEVEAKKIQTADVVTFKSAGEAETKDCVKGVTPLTAACKTAKASVTQQTAWKDADTKRVASLAKKAKSPAKKSPAKKSPAKKAKSPAKTAKTKLTSAEKKAEAKHLVTLKTASTKAAALVTADEAAQKKGDCLTTKKADAACVALAKKLVTDKADAATAATAVTTAEKAMPASGSGATVGIVIACVAAVLCIGGGAAWYIKHKKAGEANDGASFGDDLYTAFVDTEEA